MGSQLIVPKCQSVSAGMASGADGSVRAFLARLERRGVDPACLASLPAYRRLLRHRRRQEDPKGAEGPDGAPSSPLGVVQWFLRLGWGAKVGWLSVVLVAWATWFVNRHELLTHQGFSRFWLTWEDLELHVEPVRTRGNTENQEQRQ